MPSHKAMAEDEELHIACFDLRPVRAVLRYAALTVGCMAVGLAFCFDLFAVYGETLKLAFGFSQKQLALIICASNLGFVTALPTGIFVQKFDPRWLSGVAFITSTLSCLLIWGTTYHIHFYKDHFYILATFYFLLGCSGGFMYMLALSVNLLNFSYKHSGIVSGIIHCMRSVVLGALLLVYDYLNGSLMRPTHIPVTIANTTLAPPPVDSYQAVRLLQDFYQVMLLAYTGVNFLACIFYGEYKDMVGEYYDDNCSEHEMIPIRTAAPIYGTQYGTATSSNPFEISSSSYVAGSSTNVTATSTADLVETPAEEEQKSEGQRFRNSDGEWTGKWWQLLRSELFHQLLWPSVFLFAMRNAYVTNLAVIMTSFGLEDHIRFAVYSLPIAGTIAPPLLGGLADLVGHKIPRSLFYMLLAFGLIALSLINMGFAGIFPVLMVSVVWYQVAGACVQTLGPSLHLKLFSAETFPAGWGMVMLLQTVVTLLAQLLLAVLYDAFASEGSLTCTGFKCYIIYFFVCSMVSYSTVVILFFLVRYEFETPSNR